MKRFYLLIVLVLVFPLSAHAAHQHKEKEYQQQWCTTAGGVMEYVLDDHTRVDCLTETHAIEFDFAFKWAEAIGQALYYALKTGKLPGIVLILEADTDSRYLKHLLVIAEKYNIKVWTMTPAEVK